MENLIILIIFLVTSMVGYLTKRREMSDEYHPVEGDGWTEAPKPPLRAGVESAPTEQHSVPESDELAAVTSKEPSFPDFTTLDRRLPTPPPVRALFDHRIRQSFVDASLTGAIILPAEQAVVRRRRGAPNRLMSRVRSKADLKTAVLLMEVLGPPKALQRG